MNIIYFSILFDKLIDKNLIILFNIFLIQSINFHQNRLSKTFHSDIKIFSTLKLFRIIIIIIIRMCMACIWLINEKRNGNEKKRKEKRRRRGQLKGLQNNNHSYLFISSVHFLIFEHVGK